MGSARAGVRWSVGRAVVALGVLGLTFGLTSGGAAPPVQAAVGDPISSSVPQAFVATGDSGQQTIYATAMQADGTVDFSAFGTSTDFYNAIGYSPVDGFLYAIDGGGEVVRVGDGGLIVDSDVLGFPLGDAIPGGQVQGYFSGAIDPATGLFYVANHNGPIVRVIDLVAGTVTTLNLSATLDQVADFTFRGGFLWGAQADGGIVRIDVVSGSVVVVAPGALAATSAFYGAAWTMGNGNLVFSDNVTGDVWQVILPTFAVRYLGRGVPASSNDGASILGDPVDLAVTKTGPTHYAAPSQVTYDVTVSNGGPGASSGGVLTDELPAGTSFASSSSACTPAGAGQVQCPFGLLAAGASTTMTITVDLPAGTTGPVTNHVEVLGNEADPNPANDQDDWPMDVGTPGLRLTKVALPPVDVDHDGLIEAGDTIRFTFTVENTGELDLANVVVADPLAGAVTCAASTLAVGATASCSADALYVITPADQAAGSVRNTATASGTDPAGAAVASNPASTVTPVQVPAPGLTITKEVVGDAVPNGDSTFTVTYRIVARNIGNVGVTYDVVDELRFGAGISVLGVAARNTGPGTIRVNDRWDGITDQLIASEVPIGAAATHTYEVVVIASVGPAVSAAAADCARSSSEDGTGMLNTVELDSASLAQPVVAEACVPAGSATVTKRLVGTPAQRADGTVAATYRIDVTSAGDRSASYDLRDGLAWAGEIQVDRATIDAVPPGAAAEPGWNGSTQPYLTRGTTLPAGSTHTWQITVVGHATMAFTATSMDCQLDPSERGTGLANAATLIVNGAAMEALACAPIAAPLAEAASRVGPAPEDTAGTGGPDDLVRTGLMVVPALALALAGIAAGAVLLASSGRSRRAV